jgi:hypothetical protein
MKLVPHILRKDLRYHWREAALFVLACAGWAWQFSQPMGWLERRAPALAPILFFGLWLFIVVRAVQGESLVGDRQFWITRPYRWGELMAAKALFLLLVLNLPFAIVQLVLIAHAGIPVSLSLLPGLVILQLEFALFITLPAAALAAVTETIIQWGLTVAGAIMYGLVLSWLPWSKLPASLEGGENAGNFLGIALFAPALALILVWQYARRRVWPARFIFGGIAVVVPLIILLSSTSFIRSIAYPSFAGPLPLKLSVTQSSKDGTRVYKRYNSGDDANISIPVEAWTADPDTTVNVDGLRISLTGDNGWRWQSPWINHFLTFTKDSPNGSLVFSMPDSIADQMAQVHAKATVELAFGLHRFGSPQQVATQNEKFTLPGNAFCHWVRRASGEISFSELACAAPFHLPEAMQTRIESGSSTCHQVEGAMAPLPFGHHATVIEYGSGLFPDFNPDPVRKLSPGFGAWIPFIPDPFEPKTNLTAYPCRGTPLTVRLGSSEGSHRATFDLGEIGAESPEKEDPGATAEE